MFARNWARKGGLALGSRGGLALRGTRGFSSTTPASGGGFIGRLNAFLVGCGVSLGASYYLIYEELRESNVRLLSEIEKIKKDVSSLQKK